MDVSMDVSPAKRLSTGTLCLFVWIHETSKRRTNSGQYYPKRILE